jgi:hypothetical protein
MIRTLLLISSFLTGAMAEDKILTMSTTINTESSRLPDVPLTDFPGCDQIALFEQEW